MVIGIGTDIIEIDRIKNSIKKNGDRFLSKIYTPNEIKYCLSKANKYQHFAARFAAKEAVYKALATGWQEVLSWQDIEISNESTGMPQVTMRGKLKEFLSDDKSLKISISHSKNYVVCVAIIYKTDSK
ncbi:MAG: holo-ACP synthase [Bacteroidetes bacterium]|nr:holo-ACP synthase [Bacteroidota bacterium]